MRLTRLVNFGALELILGVRHTIESAWSTEEGALADLTWILETDVFPESHEVMRQAVVASGFNAVSWRDDWWASGDWPHLRAAIFHGSLGNAARIRTELPWRPGAFCATEAFCCTSWYPRASQWLLHRQWVATTVRDLVADPVVALAPIGSPGAVFVRPDSPLKPFSGRVLRRDALSLKALDHGYYYDDVLLPVVAAAVQQVGREWRYVIVDGRVVAGSAYEPHDRSARKDDPSGEPWLLASAIAAALEAPEPAYVMDICESDRSLRLLELNPFSGADLYACDREAVVRAVSAAALRG